MYVLQSVRNQFTVCGHWGVTASRFERNPVSYICLGSWFVDNLFCSRGSILHTSSTEGEATYYRSASRIIRYLA